MNKAAVDLAIQNFDVQFEEAPYVALLDGGTDRKCVLKTDPGVLELSGFYTTGTGIGSRNEYCGNWNSELRVGTSVIQQRNTETGNTDLIPDGHDERYAGVVKIISKETGGLLYENTFYRITKESGKNYCRVYVRPDGSARGAKPTFAKGRYDDSILQNIAVVIEAVRTVK